MKKNNKYQICINLTLLIKKSIGKRKKKGWRLSIGSESDFSRRSEQDTFLLDFYPVHLHSDPQP